MKKSVFMEKARDMEHPSLYATIHEDVTMNRVVAELRVVSAIDSKFFKVYTKTAAATFAKEARQDFIERAKRYNRWIDEVLAERSRI